MLKKMKNQIVTGKMLTALMLLSPALVFAEGTIFETARNRFEALTGDTSLIFCVVGALLAIAIWAAWKGSIKTLITCLICSGLVAKFSSVVDWVIKFFGKAA